MAWHAYAIDVRFDDFGVVPKHFTDLGGRDVLGFPAELVTL